MYDTTVGTEPQVLVKADIEGGSSDRRVEVYLTGKDYIVIVPETPIKKSFPKNELNRVINCIKDLLGNPLANQQT